MKTRELHDWEIALVTDLRAEIVALARRTGREYTSDDFATILRRDPDLVRRVVTTMSMGGDIYTSRAHEVTVYRADAEGRKPKQKRPKTLLDAMKADAAAACKRMGGVPGGLPNKHSAKGKPRTVDARAHEIAALLADGDMTKKELKEAMGFKNTVLSNLISRAKELGLIHFRGRAVDTYRRGSGE